jgi:uncharacterized protein GlcG (DUF336 family)
MGLTWVADMDEVIIDESGNDTIGGVGSAGSTLEVDDTCSKAGIAKVTDLLK